MKWIIIGKYFSVFCFAQWTGKNYILLPFQVFRNAHSRWRVRLDGSDCCDLPVDLRLPHLDKQLLAQEGSTLLGTGTVLWSSEGQCFWQEVSSRMLQRLLLVSRCKMIYPHSVTMMCTSISQCVSEHEIIDAKIQIGLLAKLSCQLRRLQICLLRNYV